MVICAIDVETTGLDPKKDKITEIACVQYDLKNKRMLNMFSALVYHDDTIVSDEITELTGIDTNMISLHGKQKGDVVLATQHMIDQSDYAMAHNADFEKSFLQEIAIVPPKWIDTCVDLPFPPRVTTRKLTHLCADHGIWIRNAHRALPDVMAMIELASLYDCETIEKYANSPTIKVQAVVSFADKDKARERGYRWDGDKKIWVKPVKQFLIQSELDAAKKAGFEIRELWEQTEIKI